MVQTTIHKAKTTLSRLIAKAAAGEEIVVCRGNLPVVEIVPYAKPRASRPKAGAITSGVIKTKPGCFAPLTEKELVEWGFA